MQRRTPPTEAVSPHWKLCSRSENYGQCRLKQPYLITSMATLAMSTLMHSVMATNDCAILLSSLLSIAWQPASLRVPGLKLQSEHLFLVPARPPPPAWLPALFVLAGRRDASCLCRCPLMLDEPAVIFILRSCIGK
jgi:hypothetical protein